MRLGTMVTILCYGVFSQFLATSTAFADVTQAPPAAAMLKNLKKPTVNVETPKISKKEQVNKTMLAVSEAARHKIAKIVKSEKKVAMAAPTPVSAPAVIETPIQDKVDDNIIPQSAPEHAQFTQDELQNRHNELEQQVDLAKEKEVAEAEAATQYYVEHDRELKMQQIAHALANQMPAIPDGQDAQNPEMKQQAALKAAVIRNLMPASNTNIHAEQKHGEFGFDTRQISKHTIKETRSKLSNVMKPVETAPVKVAVQTKQVEAVKPAVVQPVQPAEPEFVDLVAEPAPAPVATTASANAEKLAPDYDYLPEGAEIVAGNPYNDEFFIVGMGSSPKLKAMAEAAKHKNYVAPVVVAARNKVITQNAVTVLIKNVATQVASSADFALDPFAQYINKKGKVAPKQLAKHEPVSTLAFSKPLIDKPQAETQEVTSKYLNPNRLISANVTAGQKIIAKPIAKPVVKPAPKTQALKKPVMANQLAANTQKQPAYIKPVMSDSLVDNYLALHPHAKLHKANVQIKHEAKHEAKQVPFNVRHKPKHVAAIKKTKFAPVVQNYADLLPKKISAVVKSKHVAVKFKHVAPKKSTFVVKSYSSFVHDAPKAKPVKIKKAPVHVAKNTDHLPESF